jgi:rubrerythrin
MKRQQERLGLLRRENEMSVQIVVTGTISVLALGVPVDVPYTKKLSPNREWAKHFLEKSYSAQCACKAEIIVDDEARMVASLGSKIQTVAVSILRSGHLQHGIESGDLTIFYQELAIASGFDTNTYASEIDTVEVIYCGACDRVTENQVKFYDSTHVREFDFGVVKAVKKLPLHDTFNTRNVLAKYLKEKNWDLESYIRFIEKLKADISKLDAYKTALETHLDQIKKETDFQSELADDAEYKLKRGALESYETMKKALNDTLQREANTIYSACHRKGPGETWTCGACNGEFEKPVPENCPGCGRKLQK